MSQLTRPNLPILLLPANSNLPDALQQRAAGESGSIFEEDFRRLNSLLDEKEYLPDADSIRAELARLAVAIGRVGGEATAQTSSMPMMSREELRRNLSEALGDIDRDRQRLEEFVVYDDYFGVARSAAYSSEDFAANLTATVIRLFDDLTCTLLNMDDLAALIYAAEAMLRYSRGGSMGGTSRDLPDTAANVEFKNSSFVPDRSGGSQYRWRIGHHFFALSAAFSRHCLIAATNRLPDGPPNEIADLINLAHLSLRGTTAAMWYATNMSQAVYMDRVRPTMEEVQSGGFSGTQNLDYERLKKARDSVIVKVRQSYGDSIDAFPSEVREAFVAHCEAEVEDLEHHTLIAASKVSMNPSLLQSSGAAAYPAVDMLRLMAHGRREDLGMFLGDE